MAPDVAEALEFFALMVGILWSSDILQLVFSVETLSFAQKEMPLTIDFTFLLLPVVRAFENEIFVKRKSFHVRSMRCTVLMRSTDLD